MHSPQEDPQLRCSKGAGGRAHQLMRLLRRSFASSTSPRCVRKVYRSSSNSCSVHCASGSRVHCDRCRMCSFSTAAAGARAAVSACARACTEAGSTARETVCLKTPPLCAAPLAAHALQQRSCVLTHLGSHVSAAGCQHNAAGRYAPQTHGKLPCVAWTMCANVHLL